MEIEIGRVVPLLFHKRGNPIVDYLPAWRKACTAAVHRGRRSMKLVGREDIGMLKRCSIIDGGVLEAAAIKLAAHIEEQKHPPARIVAIRG
jgi:hypothetical protein